MLRSLVQADGCEGRTVLPMLETQALLEDRQIADSFRSLLLVLANFASLCSEVDRGWPIKHILNTAH